MERSLFIEMIHRTKGILNTVSKLTQLSREKFTDKQFREFFYKTITSDVEKHKVLLDTFLKYLEATVPIPKKGTINRLIDEILKTQQACLEAKRIVIFKKFEEDLPETIVPDEQLKFIVESLLQYAMALIPHDRSVEFLTRSITVPGGSGEDRELFRGNGKSIEIKLTFTGDQISRGSSGKGSGAPSPQEEVLSDLVLRLVEMTVRRNQGKMNVEVDGREFKNIISLRFPAERRRVVSYQRKGEP